MKRQLVIVLFCLSIMLGSTLNSNANTIIFEETEVLVEFIESDIFTTEMVISFNNLPELEENGFKITYGSEESDVFYGSTTVDLPSNIIENARSWSLVFVAGEEEIELQTVSMESGVYVHMTHVYANWTAGQPPPPDRRGLGLGAILDMQLLSSILPNSFSNTDEANILAEEILNMILDDHIDRNSDGQIDEISDGFGTLEYIYGMRDHISNAGNSNDATAEMTSLAAEINSNMSNTIIEGDDYGDFLTRLNISDADTAKLYRNAISLLDSNLTHSDVLLSEIEDLVNIEILPLLLENFNEFRNLVLGTEFNINESINVDDIVSSSSQPSSAETNFQISFGVISILSIFVLKKSKRYNN